MQQVIVLGATSKIAQEVARLAAEDSNTFLLVGRNHQRLTRVAGDLMSRGASGADYICADLANCKTHGDLIREIRSRMPNFDTVLLAYGSLSDQERAEKSADYAVAELTCNFTSAVSLLTRLSSDFAEGRKGCIAVITSVAGDRARRSNYVYGAAKGALALFMQGLRAKMSSTEVRIVTIKLGPVATPMTEGHPHYRRFADPKKVARTIHREITRGTRDIVYVPGYWRWIMFVVRHLPESFAKHMRF